MSRCRVAAAAGLLLLMSSCTHLSREPADAADVRSMAAAGIIAAAGPCVDAVPDSDEDGLADSCESALAYAFAPLLMMHSTRCTLPSFHSASRVPGGYFHAAQPVRGVVRLVYMPAYYRDCGWSGFRCIFVDCSPHAGDSELVAVDVRQTADGAWVTDAVFLSAHCFGRNEQDCRWYRGRDLEQFEWVNDIRLGAPVIWVSDARNANYPSRSACESGHASIDRCDPDPVPYRFPVDTERNIGSRAVPIVEEGIPRGCVSGAFVEPNDRLVVAHDATECFWLGTTPFRGWQNYDSGATPYGVYLDQLGL